MSLFGNHDYASDDDPFVTTRMSFGDHIEDLRTHLWRALKGFFLALVLGFVVSKPVLGFIAAPVEEELGKFYDRRVEDVRKKLEAGDSTLVKANEGQIIEEEIELKPLAKALGIKLAADAPEWVVVPRRFHAVKQAIALHQAESFVGRRPTLRTFTIMESFMIYFKVAIFCGLVLSCPWIFYQIWSFVAAGLYSHEKRLVNLYLPLSLFLFLGGVILCEWYVIPRAVEYLLDFNEWMNMEPELRLSDWLSFALLMPLLFGAAFQTPLVMVFMNKIGFMDVARFRKHRKVAWFVLAVVAALLAASPDIFSMLALLLPMWALYELGILLCILLPRKAPEIDVPDSEEMVEV